MQRLMRIIISGLCYSTYIAAITPATASELVHSFNSPAFNGSGYSSHVLTIEQMEQSRRQKIKDDNKAASDKAERDAKNTNLAKFLVNVESRIYAQLSKQLADAMFAEGSGNSGNMDFQGTSISWLKTGTDVTLTITEASGNRTDITVPLASFAF
jgi:curli production assembly/transport component CsgF